MATEHLSPMLAIPYRERTLYIPQQNYGSEARTPDLMVRINIGGNPVTKSGLDDFTEYSEINTFTYDLKRDIHSDAARALHTNAQCFLSDVTFVMPMEQAFAQISDALLRGVLVPEITFIELQNAGDVKTKHETTTFTVCYFTHVQRLTSSWGGNARLNLFACSFRATAYDVSINAHDQASGAQGMLGAQFDFYKGTGEAGAR